MIPKSNLLSNSSKKTRCSTFHIFPVLQWCFPSMCSVSIPLRNNYLHGISTSYIELTGSVTGKFRIVTYIGVIQRASVLQIAMVWLHSGHHVFSSGDDKQRLISNFRWWGDTAIVVALPESSSVCTGQVMKEEFRQAEGEEDKCRTASYSSRHQFGVTTGAEIEQ